MSEFAADTVDDRAPSSTADIAEAVIDGFEESAGDVEVSGDTPEPVADVPAPIQTVEPAQAIGEVEQLLHDEGFKDEKTADGRWNRIPWPRVTKMIENGLKKGRAEFETKFTTLETEATAMRGHLDRLRDGVAGDEIAFLRELASIDPRYGRFLEQPAPNTEPVADVQMPEPDYPLPDGSRTYSRDGIQKGIIPWLTQVITQQLEAKMEARLKPITERERATKEREHAEHIATDVRQRTTSQMEEAQTWPLFGPLAKDGSLNEVQAAVLAELKKDSDAAKAAGRRPTLSMEGAYIRVTKDGVIADRNKVRGEVIKELQNAPKGTAVARTGGEAPRQQSLLTTADIAARTLARLEGTGA